MTDVFVTATGVRRMDILFYILLQSFFHDIVQNEHVVIYSVAVNLYIYK